MPDGPVVRPVKREDSMRSHYPDTRFSRQVQMQINPGVDIEHIKYDYPELPKDDIPETDCLIFAREGQFGDVNLSTFRPYSPFKEVSFRTQIGFMCNIPLCDTLPTSSWFNMLLTQPPVVASTGVYWHSAAGENGRRRTAYTHYNSAGLRLKDLVSDPCLEHGGEACLRSQYSDNYIQWAHEVCEEILGSRGIGESCGQNERQRRKIEAGYAGDKDTRCLCTLLLKEQE